MSEKDIQKDDLIGKTKAIRDHDHDMIHDLSKRLDAVWRYDQYIENADNTPNSSGSGRRASRRRSRPSKG